LDKFENKVQGEGNMEEKVVSLNENNLQTIRNNLEKDLVKSDMRRKLIGGISEEDVTIYIDSIRHQYQQVENELKNLLKESQLSKEDIKKDYEAYRKRTGEEKTRLQEALEKAVEENVKLQEALKKAEDESSLYSSECRKKDGIIEEINVKCNELEELLLESKKTAEKYCKSIKEMEQQARDEKIKLTHAKGDKMNLNPKVFGFKNEIDAIYKQLSSLNEQVSANENLHKELELERLRAEEGERNMSQFRDWISGLKEKFHKDKIQLDIHFTEMDEKQKAMQSDINSLRENLENFCETTGSEIDNLFTTINISVKGEHC
jgi:chromosome segregation ATPase